MPEMVVTASRREMPLAGTPDVIQVIDRKTIERIRPLKTGDLLGYVTGVSVETGTGVGLPNRSVVSVNGLPASYTLVLVDGVPLLSEHIHTGQNLESIPPMAIERIEIMRGAASAQYGTGAIGGIVNIVTRKCGESPAASLQAAAGSYNTLEMGASLFVPAGEAVRVSSFAWYEESDGVPLLKPDNRVDHAAYSRMSLLNRFDFDLGGDTAAFASLNYVVNRMDFNEGTSANPDWGTADMTLATPVLGVSHAISPSVGIAGQVAHSRWDNEASDELNVFWKPDAHATWQLDKRQTVMVGGDYSWNQFERAKVPIDEQEAYGLFAQHEWKPHDRFSSMAAVRYDSIDGGVSAVSPKLSAMYSPVESLRIRASVGRGFHAPTLQQLYEEGFGHSGRAYRFGNPELEPEYSTTCTTGLEWKALKGMTFVVHGYYSDIDDMIVPVYEGPWSEDPGIDVWRRQNIEEAEVYGGEASLNWAVNGWLSLETGYTRTESENRETGRRLPYRSGSSLYGRLVATHSIGGNCAISGFVGARAAFDREAWNWKPAPGTSPDNPDGLTTPLKDYTKLDAGVSLALGSDYEVFVKVENIFGEDIENLDDAYTVIDGEPVFQAGAKYNFPL
jgi:outer membrane cobalamin receptor